MEKIIVFYKSGYKKYFILSLLILFFVPFSIIADIQLSLQPTPVVAGEPASLVISSSEGKATIDNLPEIKNLEWVQNNNVYSKSILSL